GRSEDLDHAAARKSSAECAIERGETCGEGGLAHRLTLHAGQPLENRMTTVRLFHGTLLPLRLPVDSAATPGRRLARKAVASRRHVPTGGRARISQRPLVPERP